VVTQRRGESHECGLASCAGQWLCLGGQEYAEPSRFDALGCYGGEPLQVDPGASRGDGCD
jgi:hypothetical protein